MCVLEACFKAAQLCKICVKSESSSRGLTNLALVSGFFHATRISFLLHGWRMRDTQALGRKEQRESRIGQKVEMGRGEGVSLSAVLQRCEGAIPASSLFLACRTP